MEVTQDMLSTLDELDKIKPDMPQPRYFRHSYQAKVLERFVSEDSLIHPLDALRAVADDLSPTELFEIGQYIDDSMPEDENEPQESVFHTLSPRHYEVDEFGMVRATIGSVWDIRTLIRDLDITSDLDLGLANYDEDFFTDVRLAASRENGERRADDVHNWLIDLANAREKIQSAKEENVQTLRQIEDTHNSLF